jgi:hypothetical protein
LKNNYKNLKINVDIESKQVYYKTIEINKLWKLNKKVVNRMLTKLTDIQLNSFYKVVRKMFLNAKEGTQEEMTMSNIYLMTCKAIDRRENKRNLADLYKATL